METTLLSATDAKKLIATATRIGYAQTVASGTFIAGYQLPSGEHIDHYLNFGQFDKFILVPAGYVAPRTFNDRWR